MSSRATIYGLVIAVIGFVLTRFTVTLAATDTTVQFLFAGVVPLVLGLSLAAFGVILAVGAYDVSFVRTTAVWCVLGTTTMLFLVVLTLLGSRPDALMTVQAVREQTYLSNFLIGGAMGGTLTGLYAAQNRRHQTELRQQANRLVLLNRLLRDQVINAATAIKGHTEVLQQSTDEDSVRVIDQKADAVIETVENVKYLSETADNFSLGPVSVAETLEDELDRLREEFPEASFAVSGVDGRTTVRANAQLQEVFRQLIENAVVYSETDSPDVQITAEATSRLVTIQITDTGPGLPASQQRLLEEGEISEFDDPTTGFGLNIVRLLIESFDGEIETAVTDDGTTVEIRLPRARTETVDSAGRVLTAPGVSPLRIGLATVAALVSGLTMGGTMVALGGSIPVIGALYGAKNILVAMVSHEFHSVVFGLMYAALISALPVQYQNTASQRILIAIGFGLSLWLVAAGIVMPVWLQLLGIESTVPNLTVPSFAGHVVWGITLGGLYHAGDGWLEDLAVDTRIPASVSKLLWVTFRKE